MNTKEALQSFTSALSEYKILIIVIICLMVVSLIVVKRWLRSNRMPDFFRTAFGVGRDYKSELQAIVNRYSQYTQGLSWVYGDMNFIEEKGIINPIMNIHKSYIVAFGNGRAVIIPILVRDDRITSYEPLTVDKKNIAALKYSDLMKTTTLEFAGNSEKIEYRIVDQIDKTPMITDMFARYDEEKGEIRQIHGDSDTSYSNKTVSRVTIDQKQEYTKYVQFIKELAGEVNRN